MIHPPPNTIVVPDIRGAVFVETKSIVRIEAVGNYSTLFLADGKRITVSKVLKQFESLLDKYGFARIHRSHLVNSAWINMYHPGRGELQMKNNETINVARRKKKEVKKAFIIPFNQQQSVN
jgi:two-component system, LytTR family, response regulator